METPQTLPDKLPTEALYHYSSPGGMLGILESKAIWMSNIRYQNDSEGYKHAYGLFEEIIREEYKGLLEERLDRTEVKNEFVPPVFTFSLTEEEDLLSQWRGYAPEGGYSFSFDKTQLNAFIHKYGLSVHQCIYEKDEQKARIRKDVIHFTPQEWEDVHSRKKPMDPPMSYKLKHMPSTLARLAPVLKHHAFREEKEWRIVKDFNIYGDNRGIEELAAFENIRLRTAKADGDFLKFRENKGILVPYLSLPLVEDNQFVKLSDVVVGPGAQQYIAVQACKTLLKGWGPMCLVKPSVAPYQK